MKTRIVNMNNKSRQGYYVYVTEKGVKGRYYKINSPIDNIKPYTIHFNKKYVRNEPSKLNEIKLYYNEKKPKNEYKSKYGRRSMQSILKKGIGKVLTENVHSKNNVDVNIKNRELLKFVVNDTDILNILTQEENLQKLKIRFNHKVIFRNEKGWSIAEDEVIGKLTLREIISKIKNGVLRGESVEGTQAWKRINDKTGLNIKDGKNGIISKVDIVTTFTVGKRSLKWKK